MTLQISKGVAGKSQTSVDEDDFCDLELFNSATFPCFFFPVHLFLDTGYHIHIFLIFRDPIDSRFSSIRFIEASKFKHSQTSRHPRFTIAFASCIP